MKTLKPLVLAAALLLTCAANAATKDTYADPANPALPALAFLYRSRPASERVITAILCLLIGHTAWHWLGERADALREADWEITANAFISAAVLLTILF